MPSLHNVLIRAFVVCLAVAVAGRAAAAAPEQEELKRLSIEELMRIDVTTAGRRAEPIGTTAAAVSVITGEDIRRSGVTTIADAMQLADGVFVGRLNNGTWRITARGFNASANKLLVMIDGRTVYSPLFTGVFWNVHDYPLEDIDRIEVIRGPGGALWGANAVNGVVNIITRHARDTPGTLASVSSGNEDPAIAEIRYGAATEGLAWRAYGKFALRDDQRFADGRPSGDRRRREQAGMRIDGGAGTKTWTVKSDLFHSRDEFPDRPAGAYVDGSVQGRWSNALADGSRIEVQSYYRREWRKVPQQLTHHIDTVDVDAQHATSWGARHRIVWGAGTRINRDESTGSAAIRFDPPGRTYAVSNLFVQDEVALLPDRLFSTLGVKYEHNAFSGGELQPSLRARLLLPRRQMVWGALSRAVRRPTRLDEDVIVPSATGAILIMGTPQFEAETLVATEFGYRLQPAEAVSLDATLFWHEYDDLRSQDAPPGGGLPLTLGNTLAGRSRGVELGFNVQPTAWWRTHAGYTRLETDIRLQPGSRDTSRGVPEANDPDHLFSIRTALDLPRNVELDAMLRSIGALPEPAVPRYTELSFRVGWRAMPAIEIWGAGQDLLHGSHPEFGPDTPARVEFERSLRIGITFRDRP